MVDNKWQTGDGPRDRMSPFIPEHKIQHSLSTIASESTIVLQLMLLYSALRTGC